MTVQEFLMMGRANVKAIRTDCLRKIAKRILAITTLFLVTLLPLMALSRNFYRSSLVVGLAVLLIGVVRKSAHERVFLRMCKRNLQLLQQIEEVAGSGNMLKVRLTAIAIDQFAEVCQMVDFPGVILRIDLDDDTREERGDE